MRIVDYIDGLPDVYQKQPTSNNYKLLLLEQGLVGGFWDDLKALDAVLDISNASGETLDLYGSIYGQARGSMTDEQYRVIILQRAARNLAGGDYNSTIIALANALGVSPSEFTLIEEDEPRRVAVSDLPYAALQKAGLTSQQAYQIIQSLLPAGIPLAPLDLAGTLEFAQYESEYDEEKGFGNIDQTIGGYFGLLESGDIDVPV